AHRSDPFHAAVRALAATLGATAVFALAGVGGIVLHGNLAPARRLVALAVNGALRSTLRGKLVVEHIQALGLGRIGGVRISVPTAAGGGALFVAALSAKVAAVRLVRSALLGKGSIVIDVTSVAVDHVDASLDETASGDPGVVDAFEPRPRPSTPPPR